MRTANIFKSLGGGVTTGLAFYGAISLITEAINIAEKSSDCISPSGFAFKTAISIFMCVGGAIFCFQCQNTDDQNNDIEYGSTEITHFRYK